MIDFFVDSADSYPAHEQIKERIRMALAFGELQPGDTLPSIRELGSELDIGPAIVRRAYEELARAGILTISRSRRVIVNRQLEYGGQREGRKQQVRNLAETVLKQVSKLGIHPQSFVLYLQHRVRQAKDSDNLIVFGECNRVLGDRGYDAEAIRQGLRDRRIIPLLAKRNTKHGSGLGKWRWVVEQTFAWLNQFRRLRVRYEKRADIHEAFMYLACALMCWNFLHRRRSGLAKPWLAL